MFFNALIAAFIVSLISFAGALFLFLKINSVKKIVHCLVALAAGSLLGGAFLHILPEALEEAQHADDVFLIFLVGFGIFFILERFLHWRHCHNVEGNCKVHPVGMMNLLGDGIHNFLDGVLIFIAFSNSIELGIATTLAIILHEIPQELGDFGVLIHAGYSAKKALFFNFLSACTAILGVICAYLIAEQIENIHHILLPLAAGGFLHIAASDLVPELHKEKDTRRALCSFLIFVLGVGLMWGLKFALHNH